MLDIGWSELLVIALVALIVVGPKDLPAMFKTVGTYMGKARGMAREFQRSMEAAADESGLKEASDSLNSISRYRPKSAAKTAQSYAKSLVEPDQGGGREGQSIVRDDAGDVWVSLNLRTNARFQRIAGGRMNPADPGQVAGVSTHRNRVQHTDHDKKPRGCQGNDGDQQKRTCLVAAVIGQR